MELVDAVCQRVGLNELENVQIIKDVSGKVGIKSSYLGLGAVSIVLLFIFLEYGTYWIAFAVGFAYPAYMSYKSLEISDSKDDKLWLTYWVVFSCINVFDKLFNFMLQVIPMYNILKIFYFIWLFHPATKGSQIMYDKVLRKFIKKYESQIDSQLTRIGDVVEHTKPILNDLIKDVRQDALKKMVDQALAENDASKKDV